jgi:hypothetical protein
MSPNHRRSCAWPLCALTLSLALPSTAQAACPSSMPDAIFKNCVSDELSSLLMALGAAETTIGELEDENAALRTYLTVDTDNDTVVFSGANVYIQSGSGYTDDNTSGWYGDGSGTLTGLGNLIIGYNAELDGSFERTGSHNLVVGDDHSWTSYGGLVVGYQNTIAAAYASVSGGYYNTANGYYSSISGGNENTASGDYSSVSGGYLHSAAGTRDWAAGTLWEDE